jgi:glycosyltransferase involved in cell wall biosynthesis
VRILTITHFYESHGGGIERVAGHLCRRFAALGAEAAWAASDSDPPPVGDVAAIPLRCVNPIEKFTGLPMPIPGWRACRALAQEVRCSDVVVVHDALYVTSILALLIAKARGKHVILIQHIAGIPFSSRWLRTVMRFANMAITRPMLRAAHERVFISDTVRDELLGTPARNSFTLLFNGVDSSIFHSRDRQTSDNRTPGRLRRILFVGRYVEKKGLSVLRALAELRPDLKFILVGSGPVRPGDWALANVQDLGGQSAEQLAGLYRSADALLLPSVGEGFPLVIQEAMACGLPVVCGEPSNRADPNAARWLRGVAIDLRDPAVSARRCSAAIDELCLSAADRDAMARYAAQHYSWEKMARSLMTLAGHGH